jgi:predicted amidohydrolase YtcJ
MDVCPQAVAWRPRPIAGNASRFKESLEVRKLVDLVILCKYLLTVLSDATKDIKVVETIKEGKKIYTAK